MVRKKLKMEWLTYNFGKEDNILLAQLQLCDVFIALWNDRLNRSPLSWWSSDLRKLRSIFNRVSGPLCKNSLHKPLNMNENTVIKSMQFPIEFTKCLLLICSFPVLFYLIFLDFIIKSLINYEVLSSSMGILLTT